MTLDRNINHSLSENMNLWKKARALFQHIDSNEYCGLDRLGKLIVYLFFNFLTFEDRKKDEDEKKIDIGKDLSYEDFTELAYRARQIEKESGMNEYEVFSFIISLRDKVSYNREEALKRGFDVPSNDFFSPVDFEIKENEMIDLISFIWRREISNHFTYEEVKLSESILSISDNDYVYVESGDIPGLFVAVGKDKECDVLFAINNDYERTLSKMLLFMMVPKTKWNKRKIVKGVTEEDELRNKNTDGLEYPNKIVSFASNGTRLKDKDHLKSSLDNTFDLLNPLLEKGSKVLFGTTSRFLSFVKGESKKYREMIFNLNSSLSVLSTRRYYNYILVDGGKAKEDCVLMLHLDEADIVFDDITCSEISSALNDEVENSGELKECIMRIKRDRIENNDYMLYPPYFVERKVGEVEEITEIDKKLEIKYRELTMLCRKMSK